ncbi:hypothetical protein E3U44_13715 [Nitrosococcus wardiae]|uniref:Uncharacterized protein n=1 Tax=Nitrosococcus wardiae TaxID=1814290 RepID=A0A4P7C1T9_9GAMM|nr:hypothetical protein E3U44_13715 [Nitrosococcus wardiae]
MSSQNQKESKNSLIPVTKWNDHHPWPPIGGLRHLIFFSETNDFKSAFKRVGRRVLVDEAEFFRCVEARNNEVASISTA